MEEILDKLITEIKLDQRYIDYVEAEKKLHNQEIDSLLHEYQNKLNLYDELKKYNQYIDNQEIKDEIRDLKKKIASNEDILDYYCKYHRLNDFLDEITKVVFGGISNELDLSPYQL